AASPTPGKMYPLSKCHSPERAQDISPGRPAHARMGGRQPWVTKPKRKNPSPQLAAFAQRAKAANWGEGRERGFPRFRNHPAATPADITHHASLSAAPLGFASPPAP